MALHVAQMREQDLGKRIPVGKAEKTGELFETLPIAGQRVDLLVGDHLQPVFHRAQEAISRGEIVARLAVDPAALRQHRQHVERLSTAQLGMASAGDELLGLDEELDLANATAPELD